jgi:hypothetical protein
LKTVFVRQVWNNSAKEREPDKHRNAKERKKLEIKEKKKRLNGLRLLRKHKNGK